MSLCKLIVRFDFARPCFSMLDRVGTLMGELANLPDISLNSGRFFFDTVQEHVLQRQMLAIRKTSDTYSQVTVAPQFVLLDFEAVEGVGLRELHRQEHVQRMLQMLHNVLIGFEITQIARGGARFVHLGEGGSTNEFGTLLDPKFRAFAKGMSDSVTDYGIAMEGQQSDKIGYRLTLGPFTSADGVKFFQHLPNEICAKNSDKKHIVDLDLYETDFILRVNPAKWLTPLVESSRELVESFALLLGEG